MHQLKCKYITKIAEMFEDDILPAIESELFAAKIYIAVHHSFVPAKSTTFAGMPITKQHNPSEFLANQSTVLPTKDSDPTGTGTIGNHFNFGEYSLVKYTGRSYMLTKQEGPRSITQEVDMQTLLPVRNGQKPLLDQAMRDRMRVVIDKKLAVAKKAASEKTKPAEKKIVFQWGGWLVKEYDATHYTVSKNIDKSAHLPVDDDYTDNMYEAIQVVSKKTLLPDTMLGATGKPILSASERSNILDWIAHETGPKLLKIEDKGGDPDKDRWIYRPNLSDKDAEPMTKEAIEDFEDSDLADDVPGNVGVRYELGLRWVTRMAKFYQKYPSLRAWVEGKADKTPENLKAFIASKDEAIQLMYHELYKTHFGIKNDYQKSAKELKKAKRRLSKDTYIFC